DETTGTGLLFGGYDLNALGDTWLWNGSTWQAVATPVAPTARWSSSMVFDRSRRCFVLFGGFDPNSGLCADTWEFDGVGWAQRTTAVAPPVRLSAAMAFDRFRGRSVLFGGEGLFGQPRGDTWEWDGVTWLLRSVPAAPPARTGAIAAFDPARGRTVLFGGAANGQALGDTWLWDGSSWVAANSAQNPAPRRDATVAFDFVRDEVVLYGGADATWSTNYGDTWTWDGREWALAGAGPSPRHGAAMLYDLQNGSAVLFGGRDGSAFFAETWQRASVPPTPSFEWTRVATTGAQSRIDAAIAYDAARAQTVVFGGWFLTGPGWLGFGSSYFAAIAGGALWDGSTWTAMPAGPSARAYAAMAYDSARQRTVLFGGRSGAYPMDWTDLAETWEWDGTAWAQRAVVGPPARGDHAMAYDSVRGVVVLFGGNDNSGPLFGDTWEFDGTAWIQRTPAIAPSPRAGAACAFDPILQRVVLHGGSNLSGTFYGDTWEWDGTVWTVQPGRSPTPRSGHSMVFDDAAGSLLLAGAGTGDLWERRGAEWSRLAEPAPAPRSFGAMAYDSARQRAVVFSGARLYAENFADASSTLAGYWTDTWERQPRPPVATPTTAYAVAFGHGCGSVSVRLSPLPGWRPYLGGSLRAVVKRSSPWTAFPFPLTVMALGTTANLPGLPAPIPEIPGCLQWHSVDLVLSAGCQETPAGAGFNVDIPNSAILLGLHLYGQAWGVDWAPPLNGGYVVGNAIDWCIGNW
ncbi:MAG: kelch repeat-containing protein, partial [Planctomycetota bacterium]